jgi:hypothetical protein
MSSKAFKPGNSAGKDTRFKPGVSGNPGGRAKALRDVTEAARAHAHAAIETLVRVMKDAKATASARVNAAEALLNRAWGKPQQTIEILKDLDDFKNMTDDELIALLADESEEPKASAGDGAHPATNGSGVVN